MLKASLTVVLQLSSPQHSLCNKFKTKRNHNPEFLNDFFKFSAKKVKKRSCQARVFLLFCYWKVQFPFVRQLQILLKKEALQFKRL